MSACSKYRRVSARGSFRGLASRASLVGSERVAQAAAVPSRPPCAAGASAEPAQGMRPPRSCTPRSCTRLRTRLASVALALFANAFALANPFPYAPFMVMTYGLTAKRDEVGFFAGFVLSAFMVGRLLSSYPLGLLSDAVGRRPVIEVGLWSCIVFQLAFGLSPSFGFALATRFLMGAGNGIIGVSKARRAPLASPPATPPAPRRLDPWVTSPRPPWAPEGR